MNPVPTEGATGAFTVAEARHEAARPDGQRAARAAVELGRGKLLTAVIAFGLGGLILAAGGMFLSFRGVSVEMIPVFGGYASVVPLVIDLGVFVFSALELLMTWLDLGNPALARLMVRIATAGTMYLNYSVGGAAAGRVAHVLMPLPLVVFTHILNGVVSDWIGVGNIERRRREPIPLGRYLFAPWSTARLLRRMVLWRQNSYRTALEMERKRLGAWAVAREQYGRTRLLKRINVSTLMRMLIEMGEIGPLEVIEAKKTGQVALLPGWRPTAEHADPTRTSGPPDPTGPGARAGDGPAPADPAPAPPARPDRRRSPIPLRSARPAGTRPNRPARQPAPTPDPAAGPDPAPGPAPPRQPRPTRPRTAGHRPDPTRPARDIDELVRRAEQLWPDQIPAVDTVIRPALGVKTATARQVRDRLKEKRGLIPAQRTDPTRPTEPLPSST